MKNIVLCMINFNETLLYGHTLIYEQLWLFERKTQAFRLHNWTPVNTDNGKYG